MTDVVMKAEKALDKPEPQILPVAVITDGLSYDVRVWVRTQDYWDLYNELIREIPIALNAAGIERPAAPVKVRSI
jgi:small conductance mechanosensitive channel